MAKNKTLLIILAILLLALAIPAFSSEQSEAKFRSAIFLYKDGKIQEAIEKTKEAISLDPTITYYYVFLGNAYNYLRNNDEAEKYYIKALELDPKDGSAFNGLGLVYSDCVFHANRRMIPQKSEW